MTAPNPVKGETEFQFEGETYRFVFDWEAIAAFEAPRIISFADFLASSSEAAMGGPMPFMSDIGRFMKCGLQRFHPDATEEQGCEMFLNECVKNATMEALGNAMPEDTSPGEAPAARNRSNGSGQSSANGSRRAAKKKHSGEQRHASPVSA